jgi:cell division septation protein DedD
LVFRDSILMQDFELQLLARLVNGFPAGNISVILLINSAGNYKSKLDAFGKNLLQWEVETPTGEPKKRLTDWVAKAPASELIEPSFLPEPPTLQDEVMPVSQLLNIPIKTSWRVPGFGKKQEPQLDAEPLPAFVPTPEPVPVAPPPVPVPPPVSAPAAFAATASPAVSDVDLFKRPARKSRAGWLLLVLLLSIGTFGLMYKDLVLEETELLKKYLLRGTPAVAAPAEAASAAAAASAEALATAELAASMAVEAARVASEVQVAASAASAASAPAVPAADASAPAVAVAVAAKPEANSDEAWVNQLPDTGYVVQLAAMDTQEDMRSFQRSNAVYAKTRIMRTRHKDNGKRYFILVAGPFDTKAQADAFMQSNPLLNKGWLRGTKSMKTQFSKS